MINSNKNISYLILGLILAIGALYSCGVMANENEPRFINRMKTNDCSVIRQVIDEKATRDLMLIASDYHLLVEHENARKESYSMPLTHMIATALRVCDKMPNNSTVYDVMLHMVSTIKDNGSWLIAYPMHKT